MSLAAFIIGLSLGLLAILRIRKQETIAEIELRLLADEFRKHASTEGNHTND